MTILPVGNGISSFFQFCIVFDMLFLWAQAEVNYLGQLSHPNLVKLVGYCVEDEQRLLVYEFMPRGSLENHLFRSKCLAFYFPYLLGVNSTVLKQ